VTDVHHEDAKIVVRQEPPTALAEYAAIPTAFEVNEIFDVAPEPDRNGRFALSARRLAVPYVKDYDAAGEHPAHWARRFDISEWGFFSASSEGQRVGAAAVAADVLGPDLLEGRLSVALLWDIRVVPAWRRHGVGSVLFEAAETWAVDKGFRQLKIETQNINVAACRFYAKHGCVLRGIHRGIYRELREEIQLLWYKDLHR
jgi:GNAT superfamily N-acetyltransferase